MSHVPSPIPTLFISPLPIPILIHRNPTPTRPEMERKAAEAMKSSQQARHKDAEISNVGEAMQTRRKGQERRVGSVKEGFRES